jgi:2-methylcitrate dehydratase PrpD
MNYTYSAAKMAQELKFTHLTSEIIDKTKLLILDNIGCAIGGSTFNEALRLRKYLNTIDPGGTSTAFGGRNMTAENAAHANAHSACMLSLDDSFIRFGHPGSSIIPAVLAVAQKLGSNGQDIITACVAAYEMSMRLGVAAQASVERDEIVKGYTSWQVFGSSVGASKLYDFSASKMASAFGMTALHAPLPFLRKFHSRPMNWLKNNYGWACKAGITAVELVNAGFDGNQTIFDGPNGYWAMMGSDKFDEDIFTQPYDDKSYVMDIGFKAYSGCRWSHTAIDCIRTLMENECLTNENLLELRIETVSEFVRDLDGDWPETTVDALFRTPYLVALELHNKSSALGLQEEDLGSAALKKTIKKIRMTSLDGADKKFFELGTLPVKLTATVNDGRTLQACSEFPTGHPDGPQFGKSEVIAKFLSISTPVIGDCLSNNIIRHVLELEKQPIALPYAMAQNSRY